jgi:hemerythrin-like metal-binding protein/diguanylate cyclase (GGDEF)-like protein
MMLGLKMPIVTRNTRPPEPALRSGDAVQPPDGSYLSETWIQGRPDQAIDSELARAARFHQPVTLILLHVDHFKSLHERCGLLAVESFMEELNQRIQAAVRASDTVFRWNRRELMVLATGSGHRAGERLAEALRMAVAVREFNGVGMVTASLSVAEPVPNERAVALFHRLRRLLEQTGEQGANRVVVDHRGYSDDFGSDAGSTPLRLVWQEAYESGHPAVDSEHRHLFELANALIDATFGRRENPQRVAELLELLLRQMRGHFDDEETLLERLGYERLGRHKDAHAELYARAIALREQAAEDRLQPGVLVEFLAGDVVTRHVLALDRDFYPLLVARNSRQR